MAKHPLNSEIGQLRARLAIEKAEGLILLRGPPGCGKEFVLQEVLDSDEASSYMVVDFGLRSLDANRPWTSLLEVCRAAMEKEERQMPDVDGFIREKQLEELCETEMNAALYAAGIAMVAAVWLMRPRDTVKVELSMTAVAAALCTTTVAGVEATVTRDRARLTSVTFVSIASAILAHWARTAPKKKRKQIPIHELVHVMGSGHAGFVVKNKDPAVYTICLLTAGDGGSGRGVEQLVPSSEVRPAISMRGHYSYKHLCRKFERHPRVIGDAQPSCVGERSGSAGESADADRGADNGVRKPAEGRKQGASGRGPPPKALKRKSQPTLGSNTTTRWPVKVQNNHTDELLIEVEHNGKRKRYAWDMLDPGQYMRAVTRMKATHSANMHHAGGAVPPQFHVKVPVSKGDIVRALLRGDVQGRRRAVYERTITGGECDLNVRGCELRRKPPQARTAIHRIPGLHLTRRLSDSDDPWSLEDVARVEVFTALKLMPRAEFKRPLLVIRQLHVICSQLERVRRGAESHFLSCIAQLGRISTVLASSAVRWDHTGGQGVDPFRRGDGEYADGLFPMVLNMGPLTPSAAQELAKLSQQLRKRSHGHLVIQGVRGRRGPTDKVSKMELAKLKYDQLVKDFGTVLTKQECIQYAQTVVRDMQWSPCGQTDVPTLEMLVELACIVCACSAEVLQHLPTGPAPKRRRGESASVDKEREREKSGHSLGPASYERAFQWMLHLAQQIPLVPSRRDPSCWDPYESINVWDRFRNEVEDFLKRSILLQQDRFAEIVYDLAQDRRLGIVYPGAVGSQAPIQCTNLPKVDSGYQGGPYLLAPDSADKARRLAATLRTSLPWEAPADAHLLE